MTLMFGKPQTFHSKAVRDNAQGQECTLQIPGVCSHDPEQTVHCHIRIAGFNGVGQKPSDFMGCHACQPCHDALDGRDPNKKPSGHEIMRAVFWTQHRLFEAGLLTMKGAKP